MPTLTEEIFDRTAKSVRAAYEESDKDVPMTLIALGAGVVATGFIVPELEHKRLVAAVMALHLKKMQADSYVLAATVYFSHIDPIRGIKCDPSKDINRGEGLMVVGVFADGRIREVLTEKDGTEILNKFDGKVTAEKGLFANLLSADFNTDTESPWQ